MSGLERNHQSYPEETGQTCSAFQKLCKLPLSSSLFASIFLSHSLHIMTNFVAYINLCELKNAVIFSKKGKYNCISVTQDEHGIEKISQTLTCQSGGPALPTATNEEASGSFSQSDTSGVFNGWDHRGMSRLLPDSVLTVPAFMFFV